MADRYNKSKRKCSEKLQYYRVNLPFIYGSKKPFERFRKNTVLRDYRKNRYFYCTFSVVLVLWSG
jgi:hypothetical protein